MEHNKGKSGDDVFDQYASSYSDEIEKSLPGSGDHDFFIQNKVENILEILKKHNYGNDARVLDIGCGIGLVDKYLAEHVSVLHGVDVSEESIKIAKQSGADVDYRVYDGIRLPFENNTFDCCFAICVMHHVPPVQWKSFTSEMVRVLRPGGVAIVIEHNPLNPATQWVVKNCELDADAVLLMPGKLKGLFKDSGLLKIQSKHVLFTPFKPTLFRRLDKVLSSIPFGAQYVSTGVKPS